MSLRWFNTSVENGIDTASFSGNFKVLGDIEVTGLVRRNGEVFESITPQWNTGSSGKIYFSPSGIPPQVGIGTSNPQRTLDVIGDISYTGSLIRNGQELDFGLGAWNGNINNTIYYGGNVNNRVGVGVGFGPNIIARGVIHAWGLSQFNIQTGSSWDPRNGIRVGPHEIGNPFLQMGVMKSSTNSWSWLQSAEVSTITNNTEFSTITRSLMINPDGGNVGIGVSSINNVDASLSISSRGEFIGSGFRKTISMGPETHTSPTIDYNHIIYSKNFAIGFRDGNEGNDRGLHIMTNTNSTSWRMANWKGSVVLSCKESGNVGIGTMAPRLRLSVSSTSNSGILISNPTIEGNLGYGIQRLSGGLALGPLRVNDDEVDNVLLVRDSLLGKGITVSGSVDASVYSIGDQTVLSTGQLGPSILTSSLRSVGSLTSLTVMGNVGINTNPSSVSLNVSGEIFSGAIRSTSNSADFNQGLPGIVMDYVPASIAPPFGHGRIGTVRGSGNSGGLRFITNNNLAATLGFGVPPGFFGSFDNVGIFTTGLVQSDMFYSEGLTPRRVGVTASFANGLGGVQSDWPAAWGARALQTSDISCLGLYYSTLLQRSDIRHKNNIDELRIGLNELILLRPVTYNLKSDPLTVHYGFIAQEVEKVLPDFVGEDTNDMKYVKDAITPLTVKSIIELNEKLENEVKNLRTEISDLKNMLMTFINK